MSEVGTHGFQGRDVENAACSGALSHSRILANSSSVSSSVCVTLSILKNHFSSHFSLRLLTLGCPGLSKAVCFIPKPFL